MGLLKRLIQSGEPQPRDEPWRLVPLPPGGPTGETHVALRPDGAGMLARFFVGSERNVDVAAALGEAGNPNFRAWKWGWDFSFDDVLLASATPQQLWATYGVVANQAAFILDALNGLMPKEHAKGPGYANLPVPDLPGCPWDGSRMTILDDAALQSLLKFNRHFSTYMMVARRWPW